MRKIMIIITKFTISLTENLLEQFDKINSIQSTSELHLPI